MTTVLTQLNELAQTVEAIAANVPGAYANELDAIAYVLTDAANTAHLPRLRHIFDVPVGDVAVQPVTPVTPPSPLPPPRKKRTRRKSSAQEKIWRYVRLNPGVTIADIVVATGYTRSYTQVTLGILSKEGKLRRSGHGPNKPAQWWAKEEL